MRLRAQLIITHSSGQTRLGDGGGACMPHPRCLFTHAVCMQACLDDPCAHHAIKNGVLGCTDGLLIHLADGSAGRVRELQAIAMGTKKTKYHHYKVEAYQWSLDPAALRPGCAEALLQRWVLKAKHGYASACIHPIT